MICETSLLQRSFGGLVEIYIDSTETMLKLNNVLAYPLHVVWRNGTERKRRHPADHRYALLGFLPVETAEMGAKDEGLEVDKIVLMYMSI